MKQAVGLTSLKRVLGSAYLPFLEREVLDRLKDLAENGEIDTFTLKKIADSIEAKGIDGLDHKIKLMTDPSINNLRGGNLYDVTLYLDQKPLHILIKQFPTKAGLERAVKIQRSIYEVLQETTFQTPEPRYINPKLRMLTMPFIEGDTLQEALQDKTPIQKEKILKMVINDYLDLFEFLDKNKDKIEAEDETPDFNEYFLKNYLNENRDKKLFELYQKEIGDILNQKRNRFIHGDLHVKNVIIDGTTTFIDWENAAKNGFPEFDIGRLLSRAAPKKELEDLLVNEATERINPENPEESVKTYQLNRISKGLSSTKRYLDSSKQTEDSKEKQRLESIATALFNLTLRRIRMQIKERNLLSNEFLEEAISSRPELKEVDDQALETLLKDYDPNTKLSHEHLLYDTETEITHPAEKSISRIRNAILKQKIYGIGKKILSGLLAVGICVGSILATDYHFQRKEKERIEKEYEEQDEDIYRWQFKNSFNTYQRNILNEADSRLPLGRIEKEAENRGLDRNIVKNILDINRLYASINDSRLTSGLEGINIIDPLTGFGFDSSKITAEEKLSKDLDKLSGLLKKHKGDIKKTLIELYTPNQDYNKKAIAPKIKELVYTVLTGPNYAYDGGLNFRWLKNEQEIPPQFFDN